MSITQLIKTTFSKVFNKYVYDEMVVGKLAHTELKTGKNKGDEVNVLPLKKCADILRRTTETVVCGNGDK